MNVYTPLAPIRQRTDVERTAPRLPHCNLAGHRPMVLVCTPDFKVSQPNTRLPSLSPTEPSIGSDGPQRTLISRRLRHGDIPHHLISPPGPGIWGSNFPWPPLGVFRELSIYSMAKKGGIGRDEPIGSSDRYRHDGTVL